MCSAYAHNSARAEVTIYTWATLFLLESLKFLLSYMLNYHANCSLRFQTTSALCIHMCICTTLSVNITNHLHIRALLTSQNKSKCWSSTYQHFYLFEVVSHSWPSERNSWALHRLLASIMLTYRSWLTIVFVSSCALSSSSVATLISTLIAQFNHFWSLYVCVADKLALIIGIELASVPELIM